MVRQWHGRCHTQEPGRVYRIGSLHQSPADAPQHWHLLPNFTRSDSSTAKILLWIVGVTDCPSNDLLKLYRTTSRLMPMLFCAAEKRRRALRKRRRRQFRSLFWSMMRFARASCTRWLWMPGRSISRSGRPTWQQNIGPAKDQGANNKIHVQYNYSLLLIFAVGLLVILGLSEIGWQLGKRQNERSP